VQDGGDCRFQIAEHRGKNRHRVDAEREGDDVEIDGTPRWDAENLFSVREKVSGIALHRLMR
jgi:hypothetical protein